MIPDERDGWLLAYDVWVMLWVGDDSAFIYAISCYAGELYDGGQGW